jgi:hypothetical protein
MPTEKNKGQEVSVDAATLAILALLIDEREQRIKETKGARKTEVLLAAAGLSGSAIASLVGKNVDAVRKTLQREHG